MPLHDAIVVGSGPNGLAAAITLARAGLSVLIREAAPTIGGGTRTQELTLPGFHHDVCSAIHTLPRISHFLRTVPLEQHGVQWIEPEIQLAHPFDDGSSATLHRDLDTTLATLAGDAPGYRALLEPLLVNWDRIAADTIGPLHFPRYPLTAARFGATAIRSAAAVANARFTLAQTRALFAGLAAHAMIPLTHTGSSAFALVLAASAHLGGWLIPRGGSHTVSNALASYFRSLGGEILTGQPVHDLREVENARAVLLDVAPRNFARIAGERLPRRYASALHRFRHGPGAFKIDWALDAPVPWTAESCRRAGTIHVGGTLEEIVLAESRAFLGERHDKPFVLAAQQSLFDDTRAPGGRHTLWGYCHVPNGDDTDVAERVEAQIERFAPGFRERILARHLMPPSALEQHNPNNVGGDIGGGANILSQIFFRPVRRRVPYATPLKRVFLCSSSTPPGGGVHGLCGYYAARAALRDAFGLRPRD